MLSNSSLTIFYPDITLTESNNPSHFTESSQMTYHFQVSREVVTWKKGDFKQSNMAGIYASGLACVNDRMLWCFLAQSIHC